MSELPVKISKYLSRSFKPAEEEIIRMEQQKLAGKTQQLLGGDAKKSDVFDVDYEDIASPQAEIAKGSQLKYKAPIAAGVAAGLLSGDTGPSAEAVVENPIPPGPPPSPDAQETKQTEVKASQTDVPKEKADPIKYSVSLKFEDMPDIDPKVAEEYKQKMAEAASFTNSAMDVYRNEKDSIKSRQLWETIVNAVGMIASGMYGLKTGTNMGGTKFSSTDWSKELDGARADLENSIKLSDRKEAAAARSRAMSVEDYSSLVKKIDNRNQNIFNKAQLAFRAAAQGVEDTRKAQESLDDKAYKEALLGVKKKEAAMDALNSMSKGEEGVQKVVLKATALIADAAGKKKDQKEAAYAEAKTLLSSAGIDVPQEVFETPGMIYGTNLNTPAEIIVKLNELVKTPAESPAAPSGLVDMIDPQGRVMRVPANEVAELEKLGAKRK